VSDEGVEESWKGRGGDEAIGRWGERERRMLMEEGRRKKKF
jgi:hypothetical protein